MTLFVVRDLMPAGLFIGEREADGTLVVKVDYVIPGYRDLKIGKYLLEDRADFFRERGVRRFVTPPGSPEHAQYLRRIGFVPQDAERYLLNVERGR